MKFISWNVNGLRACAGKGFADIFKELDADFFCLQETKMQAGQLDLEFEGYESYWNYAEKKGYSGTAIYTKHKPLSVAYGLGIEEHDKEGRVITLEYGDFYLVTVYVPNSQDELRRLDYRMEWEDAFRNYLLDLDKKKPVIVCGPIGVMPVLPMRSEKNSQYSWMPVLLIPSAISSPTLKAYTHGGRTDSKHAQRTPAGVSTTLFPRSVWMANSLVLPFIPKFTVPTIARWKCRLTLTHKTTGVVCRGR